MRAAVVQACPVIMDREATIARVAELAVRAEGAQLLLFPEAFVPAYPRGLAFGTAVGSRTEAGRRDWARYWRNAVDVPGPATAALGEVARAAGAYLVIGVIERDGGTLYCTILYFGPDGALLGKHRKLKPTAAERLIWGEGDGSTLTVVDTPYGKLGGLICWENYMPLARTAMYAQGVRIYVAPTADARESWQATIRHIALEGRCFVLACNQFVRKADYPRDLACYDELAGAPAVMCAGGSAIVGPLGEHVVPPVYGREEILVADLDMDLVTQSRFDFDPVGSYARPDVFRLVVNTERQESVRSSGAS